MEGVNQFRKPWQALNKVVSIKRAERRLMRTNQCLGSSFLPWEPS
jgi:hypothetical protein